METRIMNNIYIFFILIYKDILYFINISINFDIKDDLLISYIPINKVHIE
jgi:hypothetical protein